MKPLDAMLDGSEKTANRALLLYDEVRESVRNEGGETEKSASQPQTICTRFANDLQICVRPALLYFREADPVRRRLIYRVPMVNV